MYIHVHVHVYGRSQWKTSDYTYSCSYNVDTNRDAVVVHSVSHCILF